MRVILSRKGFDTASGGVPSPIVEGVPVPLPIPQSQPGPVRFRELPPPLPALVRDLTGGSVRAASFCHADPDLGTGPCGAAGGADFVGVLGQHGAAQGHLRNQGVGAGDLFLFWGLFQPVARQRRRWRFVGAPEHRLFGWLQVDEVVPVAAGARVLSSRTWLDRHPHLHGDWGASNTLYLARQRLVLGGRSTRWPGWGLLRPGMRLSAPDGARVSDWQVPAWLHPQTGGTGMSYHRAERWSGGLRLSAVARGQEFVADAGGRVDVRRWLRQLLTVDAAGRTMRPA